MADVTGARGTANVGAAPETGMRAAMAKRTPLAQPPNLRRGTNGQACALCVNYRASSVAAGRCAKYGGTPVRPTQVCDSFEAKGR
jgi:hypothetical protein